LTSHFSAIKSAIRHPGIVLGKIMEDHRFYDKHHGKSWKIMENIGTSSYNSRFLTGFIVENRRLQACVDDDAAFQAEAAKAGKRPSRR
jgi:hypothetical protein